MSILNLEYSGGSGGRAPRNKRAVKVWVGVGLVAAVLGVGSTLASTITLNNGKPTEFGQGYTSSVYCGGNQQTVQVTPKSVFDNTTNDFYLGAITVSGIPAACAGVDFSLSVYDAGTTQNPLPMTAVMADALTTGSIADAGVANIWWANNCPTAQDTALLCTGGSGDALQAAGALIWYKTPGSIIAMDNTSSQDVSVSVDRSIADAGSFTLTLPSSPYEIKSSDTAKVVIETRPDVNGFSLWNNGTGAVLTN